MSTERDEPAVITSPYPGLFNVDVNGLLMRVVHVGSRNWNVSNTNIGYEQSFETKAQAFAGAKYMAKNHAMYLPMV